MYNGDGFWMFPDPSDPDYIYAEYQGGEIGRVNRHTHEARNIKPRPNYKEKLRFNWNTPIALSPNEKGTIYIGSQFLFRSRDHGVTWDRISPDLSTNDPVRQRQEQSGGITVDNSSAEMNTTIYSISESPRAAGQIWIGTDDGNVQLTRDGGRSWNNLTRNLGMPTGNWISWVDAGRTWAQFKPNNFPDGVAVRDIALQDREDDMLLATHGRGIWVVDDISPLRALSAQTLASAVALIPGQPVQQRIQGNGGWAEGN